MTEERRVNIPWWVHDACSDTTPMRTQFVVGGLGGGKSHGGQIWDIYRILQNGVPRADPKPSISWTVAPNYRICETLLELTLQVANDCFFMQEGTHYELRRSFPRTLDFTRAGLNHRAIFLSASHPEHFVSSSITHWRWSEVAVSKPEVFGKLMDRLRDPRAKILQGIGDSTPEGFNHFYEWAGFIGTKREATDPTRNIRVYRVETGDNMKNLAPGYLEALRARYAYSPSLLESYERGIFTDFRSEKSAYWEFIQSRNVIDFLEPSPQRTIAMCWDFNLSPIAVVVNQEVTYQRNYYSPRESRWVSLWESSGQARGLMDAVAEFAAHFPVSQYAHTRIELHGDASGYARRLNTPGSDYHEIEKYLRALGYHNIEICAPKANPTVRHRLETTAALMAYERYLVSTRCRRLIASYAKTSLKDGTFDIEKPSGEDWTHYADAATYHLFQVARDVNLANPQARKALGTTF